MNDHAKPDVERLNFVGFDVEALERRLELVEPGTARCSYCNADSAFDPPVQPAAG